MKIRNIKIRNFRGIKSQTISNVNNALVLIGKNNSGKSAVLSAVRAFWGDYKVENKDYYKGTDEIHISIQFQVDIQYLLAFFLHDKIGFEKYPSSQSDYEQARQKTCWENRNYSDFRQKREESNMDEIQIRDLFESIWINSLCNKLELNSDRFEVDCLIKNNSSAIQYNGIGMASKDFQVLLPAIAFIDDTRNFEDEETGKTQTLTSKIIKIIQAGIVKDYETIKCTNCLYSDCEDRNTQPRNIILSI